MADTVNVPVVDPAGIVMLEGTVAILLLLERFIVAPPAGAGAVKVTDPVEVRPLLTVVGFSVTADNAAATGGVMVSAAVLFTPL